MPMSLSHCGTRRLSSTTVRSALLLLLFLALSARQTSAADSSQEPKPPNRQQEYLRKNVELQGVVELESGLQYQILKSGDAAGPSPGPNTPCAVHYRGTTIDRIEFDGTRGSMFGFPALFAPSGVIRGWTEAMQLMHEGDRWRLVIPQHLAYGERGAGSHIGPGATLIFDMELVKVFEGEARQYPGSFILENPVLGPIPSMDYFCVRTWMVLIVLIGWLIYDICKTDKNDGLKKRR